MKSPQYFGAALLGIFSFWACGGLPASPVASTEAPSGASATTASTNQPVQTGPPNIVIVLADDLGYGDLSVYGNSQYKTPTIDRLAAEGTRFTDFYVPYPVCAPSRAALLSGRVALRNGVRWNNGTILNKGEILLASVLKARGYATGIVGKWHLGYNRTEMPPVYGFDFFYGTKDSPPETDFVSGDLVTTDFPGMDLVTERFTQESLKFLRQSADKPVFLYLAHHVAHAPAFASFGFAGSTARPYSDAIVEMDRSLERIMTLLREQGKDRNTLVIFTSDNGPENVVGGSTGPLIGTKGTVHEGGVRVPFIAWWPGQVPAGRVVTDPAMSLDLFPTLVSITGATLPSRQYDGVNIAPLLLGQVSRIEGQGLEGGRDFIFWGSASGVPTAIRSGRWKYIRGATTAASSGSLFDVVDDPGEQKNLIRPQADLATLLLKRLDQLGK